MIKKHVFISYKSEEREDALAVRDFLIRKGFNFWMDENDIRVGENYAEKIDFAVKNSFAIVLVMSEESVNSPHVQSEVMLAAGEGIPVLAFVMREFRSNDIYNFNLPISERYDAFDDIDGAFEKLYNQLACIKQAYESKPQSVRELFKLWYASRKAFGSNNKVKHRNKSGKDSIKLYTCFPLNLTPYSKKYSADPNVRLALNIHTIFVMISIINLFAFVQDTVWGMFANVLVTVCVLFCLFAVFVIGENIAGLFSMLEGKIPSKIVTMVTSVISGLLLVIINIIIMFMFLELLR